MPLTAPLDATVVMTAKRAEATMPNRVSLPSKFGPSTPGAWISGLPAASAEWQTTTPTMNRLPIAARIAQPWRGLPTMRPKTLVRAAPMAKIDTIWIRFDKASGFSNGWAELTLKNPPPLVPSILIASCEATGPTAIFCWPLPAWLPAHRRPTLRLAQDRRHT